MRVFSFMMTLLVLALLFVLQAPADASDDKTAEIDSLLTRSQRHELFNGAALVAEGGEVILKKGYGWADMEWEIPNTPDTKFRLGSVTKQFTAMLVMQLVEAGLIDLDGTISDYLPYYREDTGGRITIHHLLCHQTGIPNFTEDPEYNEYSKLPTSAEALVREHCTGDLLFEPGEEYRYSNSNYVILGAIIEAVTGQSCADVLKDRILDPLEMRDSGYDSNAPIIPNRAAGYEPTLEGYANARYIDMSVPHAAGGMYATVGDLYRWDQALYTDQLLADQYRQKLFAANRRGYAYGWTVGARPVADTGDSVRTVSHGGGINGFQSVIVRLPDEKHLIVLLSNAVGGSLSEITQAIVNILYGQPYELPRQPISRILFQTISADGMSVALSRYHELKSTRADGYDFREFQLNLLGYGLIERGMVDEAIEIFKLNVEAYPEAFNTYDSLGEAYMIKGEKGLALQNLRKSLELNPDNTHAEELIKQFGDEE